MNRRSFLSSALPVAALSRGLQRRKKWKAVLMVGIPEEGPIQLTMENNTGKPVTIRIECVAIMMETGSRYLIPINAAGASNGEGHFTFDHSGLKHL